MHTVAAPVFVASPLRRLAFLTFLAGGAGMATSFCFLASADPLDVLAGAAGFAAGALLASAGLVSLTVLRPSAPAVEPAPSALPAEPPLAAGRWLAHFDRNRLNRPEPAWGAPVTLPAAVLRPLVKSLAQFELGDGGGPAYLIAWDREAFLTRSGARELVDRWFAEEREHSRLLGKLVARLGGTRVDGHWSFTAFCLSRRWFGVLFELTVLLLTEIVSTVYYRLLQRHGRDEALRGICRLILRDEAGHVALHRDRLAAARLGRARYGWCCEVRFRVLGLAAATVLWASHAPGLRATGATGVEFYREVWRGLSLFIRRLPRESLAEKKSCPESPSYRCRAVNKGEVS